MEIIYRLKVLEKFIKLLLLFLMMGFIKPENSVINVLSYNIQGLPDLFTSYKNPNRIEEIIKNINNYDLVLLQENWVYQDIIRDNFSKDIFIISSKNKFNKKNNSKRSSGLNIIVSEKLKIQNHEEHIYSDCNGWLFNANDCLASKGFIYSKLLINSDTLNVYVTHLDAGNSKKDINVRQKQLHELSNSIEKISNLGPLIITGDFNINYYTNPEIINSFIDKFGLNNLNWESNLSNDIKIDYVFFRDGTSTALQIYDEGVNRNFINYSDHYPIQFKVLLIEVAQ